MNKHLNGGNEMKHGKMKIGSLIGVLLFCVSTQVAAEVCEAELGAAIREGAMGGDGKVVRRSDGFAASVAHIASEIGFLNKAGSYIDIYPDVVTNTKALKEMATDTDNKIRILSQGLPGNRRSILVRSFEKCIFLAQLSWLEGRGSSTTFTPPSGTATSNRPPENASTVNSQQANRLNKELREAETRAQNNQAKVDRARKGKPKRHVEGSVAHQCLKPQKGGGMLNMCPYAVEYSYCVLRPSKDSWSEAFDCDKGLGGSWQVGRGPNTPVLIHTGGETTYWFACRYGESLSKPDGISPVDIEYQRGRGLLGRCAEWGAGK